MNQAILALNAGSSSLKFGVYDIGRAGEPRPAARGSLEMDSSPHIKAEAEKGKPLVDRALPNGSLEDVLEALLTWIETEFGERRLTACGHRIVHGGSLFFDPVVLTPEQTDAIDALSPLAPLHQPHSINPIRAIAKMRPRLRQIGCFDTAFHRTIRPPASCFALPRAYEGKGIRRYGFHGLSYESIASRLQAEGKSDRRTIVAHLGNGASLCAMRNGASVDTTMGFSTLDGLVMGTRCGALDPGVLLYLLQQEGMAPHELQHLLYEKSGLLGISEMSADMRELEASADPKAREAFELFVFRATREIAALANTLGGLDCLVFTAGIGEHSGAVRKAICGRLGWLGVAIDDDANLRHGPTISTPASTVEIRVMPTDEESVIARHVLKAISEI
ncbi:acetate/propionate family kinase [Mesorhizobium sp. CA14]|uniref:acetate/propionate family kinase n=1 Tax=Mesorhizobium sp. CA14 TaxID=2876642 RepID=UPI001CCBE2CC|nr:acetate/propionate family kinase [Mesorhizobium sp. CA14]MBZ9848292.1 acetate/propionate family kinase [Mesorhizobium sp. CA14]